MRVLWIGLAILAAAILDAWLILRFREHTLPAGLRSQFARLRLPQSIPPNLNSPVRPNRTAEFILGLALISAGFWLFNQAEPYIELPRLALGVDRMVQLGVHPLENTLLGVAALVWGGVHLTRSLRPPRRPPALVIQPDRPAVTLRRSNLRQAGLLLGALLIWGVLMLTVDDPKLPTPLLLALWIGPLAASALALAAFDRQRRGSAPALLDQYDALLMLLLLAAGLALGVYRLGQVPASMIGDEGRFWEVASGIARGSASIHPFGFGVYSFPLASSLAQAAILRVFGLSLVSWRMASVIPAILAVLPTYLLARELFNRTVALLSGGLMLTSPYFLAFARLGYNNAQCMLPVALALYLLVAGLRRRSLLTLFAAGVATGLGFYTYTAGRLGLVIAGGFLLLMLWWRRHGRSGRQIPRWDLTAPRPPTAAVQLSVLLLGWALTVGPHLAFGSAQSPGLLVHKTLESIFANVEYAGTYYPESQLFRDHGPIQAGRAQLFFRADLYLRLLAGGTLRTALAFLHPRLVDSHYVWGALAGAWAAPLLVLGVARCLAGPRQLGASLLLLWFLLGALLLSAINTHPPRHQHLVAVIPATSILCALGLLTASEFLARAARGHRRAIQVALALAGMAGIAAGGVDSYFVRAQRHFVPNFEDRVAFEALSLRASRTLVYLYDDSDEQQFVPWVIRWIPNRASYQTIALSELERWVPDLGGGYTVYFQQRMYERVRDWISADADRAPSLEIFRDPEGRAIGMAYRFGPGSAAPNAQSPGEVRRPAPPGPLFYVAVVSWLGLLAAKVCRHRIKRRVTGRHGETAMPPPRSKAGTPGELAGAAAARLRLLRSAVGIRGRQAACNLRSWVGQLRSRSVPDHSLPSLHWASAAGELTALAVLVAVFSSPFLSRNPQELLPGNEYGVMSHPDQVLLRSLRDYRTFPLWNSYIRIGHPFVADPFQLAFNPLVTIPVLTLGVANGFKLAVSLSLLVAAWGQWSLGRVLGFDRPARLWSAAVFALNGQAVARFIQGQYNFIFGYGWIPFVLAGLVLSLRHRRRSYYALTALAIAVLYFSGTTYYPFYMALLWAALTLVVGLGDLRQGPKTVWRRMLPLLSVAGLTLGLVALQLLPALEFRPYLVKPGDPQLEGSLTLVQALESYFSVSRDRADLLPRLPPEEFYAYVGPVAGAAALLSLGGLASGWRRREVLALMGLLAFTLGWAAMRHTPAAVLYRQLPVLNQFRYPSRALIFGGLALVTLGGLGLTWTLEHLHPLRSPQRGLGARPLQRRAGQVAAGLLLSLMVLSVADVFRANVQLTGLTERFTEADVALRWLRLRDPGLYYVGVPKPVGWHDAVVSQGIRYWDAWYGFDFLPPGRQNGSARPLRPAPNYLVYPNEGNPPFPDAVPLAVFARDTAYQITDSLPFAFYVPDTRLEPADLGELNGAEVIALSVDELDPNRFRLRAELQDPQGWVVLRTAFYPGWKVLIDREPAPARPLAGFVAARAAAGEHEYLFRFTSPAFNLGLGVSAYFAVVVALIFATDPAVNWSGGAAAGWLRRWLASAIRALRAWLAQPTVHLPWPPARRSLRADAVLFVLALAVYLSTRFIRLADFPIYFFTDEAVQTTLASEFVRDGFRDSSGSAWPTYFDNSSLLNLSLSVYLQVLPAMLLPRSVFVTRAVPALVTLGAAAAVALMLKHVFRARTWWAAPLLLAVVPTWFLHSRTAFETSLMVSFYAWFLYFYLMYRRRSPRYIFPALLCGGLAFYSYSPGQLIVVVTGLLLLISDFRDHWHQRRLAWRGGLLLALLAIPYLRFQSQHPGETYFHLRMVESHWFLDLPLIEKLSQSAQLYLQALDPGYWFLPHQRDVIRHIMRGYPFIPTAMLPLAALGLLRGLRRPDGTHRTLLLSALAVPVGAAVAGLGITRVLAFIVPVTALAGLGLEAVADRVKPALARRAAGLGLVAGLSLAAFGMLADALRDGPTWYDDYTLYGMQYGARQVFGEIGALLEADSGARVVLSPIWTNGTNVLQAYFMPDQPRLRLEGGVSLLQRPWDDLQDTTWVLTPDEYQAVRDSPLFATVRVLKTLPYPDGRPGFYFLKLRYAADAEQQLARQLEERRKPVTGEALVDGEWISVEHSPFDMGDLPEIFDGDPFTLARTRESNPAVLALTFPAPRPLTGLTLTVSSMDLTLRARVRIAGEEAPASLTWEFIDLPSDPTVEVQFWGSPRPVEALTLEIEDRSGQPTDNVHILDLILR